MGGIWFVNGSPPLLWHAQFPLSIQARLVMECNPHSNLTMSDFKLTGVVAHQDILVQLVDACECTFTVLNDNSPTVSCATKGSITSWQAAAYLLRLSSLHQRHQRYHLHYDHIAGLANAMADDASHLWHLSDSQLLAYFDQTYPQSQPWQLWTLQPQTFSTLISTLQWCSTYPSTGWYLGHLAHLLCHSPCQSPTDDCPRPNPLPSSLCTALPRPTPCQKW
jgi:hypothetical protein